MVTVFRGSCGRNFMSSRRLVHGVYSFKKITRNGGSLENRVPVIDRLSVARARRRCSQPKLEKQTEGAVVAPRTL